MIQLFQHFVSRLPIATVYLVAIFSAFLFVTGCERQTAPEAANSGKLLFTEPVKAVLSELPSEAIPIWRQHSDGQLPLILFADDPMLQPIHPNLQADIKTLLTSGTTVDFRERGPLGAATTLVPSQVLTAVLQQGLFSEVIWVISKPADSNALAQTGFIDTLFTIGAIDDYERKSFKITEYGQAGMVSDTPFQIVYRDRLPTVTSPVLIQFDLSFFNGLYDNEIKTPFFSTLKALALKIRERKYQSVATTISYSNLNNWVPIEKRFAGETLKELLAQPNILDEPMLESWQRKARALYLEIFFQNKERAEIFLPLVKKNPDQAADTYWELYATTIKFASFDEAIGYLDQAVARDPAYAIEYFDIANKAQQRGLPKVAVTLWQKASSAFPDNPYVKLQEIKARSASGDDAAGLRSDLTKLSSLPWSIYYNKPIIEEIDSMLKNLKP